MLAFLEYLYTDHSPIEEGDSVGILVLANEYVMPRLTSLCELYITKEVDRATVKCIARADIDVICKLTTLPSYPSPHTPPLIPLPSCPSPHTPPLIPLPSYPSPHTPPLMPLPSPHTPPLIPSPHAPPLIPLPSYPSPHTPPLIPLPSPHLYP